MWYYLRWGWMALSSESNPKMEVGSMSTNAAQNYVKCEGVNLHGVINLLKFRTLWMWYKFVLSCCCLHGFICFNSVLYVYGCMVSIMLLLCLL